MSTNYWKRSSLWAFVGLAGLLCLPAVAQDLASVNIYGSGAEWTAQVPHRSLVLTVSGEGYWVRSELEDGARPSFEPYDDRGNRLPDGIYNWELVIIPRIEDLPAEHFENGRPSADGSRFRAGTAPERQVAFGSFWIQNGTIVGGGLDVEPAGAGGASGAVGDPSAGPVPETVISGDLTVYNSLCVGFDCLASESYGSDTIRLKENNLRIHFDDTSSAAGFPSRDWRIVANDQASGGANKFSIDDVTGGRTPFTLTAGAPSHSLFVDSTGRVGLGTSTPVVELHSRSGDTPTLRLEQDGSSGFAPQTWDVAGNETNFFVRDVNAGSTLPFRIFPGAASGTLVVDSNSEVGIGTTSPSAKLEVVNNVAGNPVLVEFTNTTSAPVLSFDSSFNDWTFSAGNFFNIATGGGATELQLDSSGNLTITGNVITSNCPAGCGPDYVFEPDYELMPLDELDTFITENRHLPKVPPATEMQSAGINMTQLQLQLLEKVEELTLYAIAQEKTIRELQQKVDQIEGGQQD